LDEAHASGPARGRLAGQAKSVLEDGTLRCGAEKLLRPQERRTVSDGSVRIVFRAKKGDCRSCRLAPECLGRRASGAQPRRVSAVRKRITQPMSPNQRAMQRRRRLPSRLLSTSCCGAMSLDAALGMSSPVGYGDNVSASPHRPLTDVPQCRMASRGYGHAPSARIGA
jgi:hypothetical protein